MASTREAPRKRMSAADRREQVLDVARALVTERGFPRVSIQAVAERAGVTRPVIYEHFGSLEGLLEAIVERELGRALEQIEQTAIGDLGAGEPRELLLESLSRYLAAVAAQPQTWQLVLTAPEGAPASLRRRVLRGRERVRRSITDAVRPGVLPGALSEDPELTARVLSAIADEYALMVLEDPQRFTPELLLEHARGWLAQAGL